MNLRLQKVCEQDRDLLFQWVNDETCRKNSFHSHLISYEEHCKWFAAKFNDEMCYMYLCCLDDIPIGQIRIECENGIGCVSYFVDCEYRGRGYGFRMLQLIEQEMQGKVKELVAYVKNDNIASQVVFKKNKYSETQEKDCVKYSKNVLETEVGRGLG